ncbi:MAG: phosphotransferase [Deltaproteobacteria bacterium]|nr:phosphotransferase [Deltaproteobacteria bacterium]
MAPTIDERAIQATLSAFFRAPAQVAQVAELAGDASTRRYYRVRMAPGSPLSSLVLMRYPDNVPPGGELPFVNVHRYLRKAGVPVPEIYLAAPEAKLLFLEDAGDTMLEGAVRTAKSEEEHLPLYELCVEILARIQWDGTKALDGNAFPARLAFDVKKFAEEIDFFFEHAVREYGGIALSESEEKAIEDLFLPFLEELASLPRVLAHRDYHSRNVMVMGTAPGRPPDLRILDFQDARMGNVYYDLCSLFRDSYVTLPEKAIDHLGYVYRHAAPSELRALAGRGNEFTYRLDVAALQRNVKAIGTFGNQARNRGKTFYLRFIPPTVAHLAGNFERNREMRPLARKLLPILSALAEKAAAEASP